MDETMLTTLYCIIDDFINAFISTAAGQKMIYSYWKPKRGPQRQLILSEVLTLNILRFSFHIFDLKAFVRLAECSYKTYFPGLPNYENFVKAANQSFPFTVIFLQYLIELNRRMSRDGLFFLDSTALSVCENWNISTHRVMKRYASRGKTGKGWFYGFKLHGACDKDGNIVGLRFSTGSKQDSQQAEVLIKGLKGLFVGDAGYLLKQEVFVRLFENHQRIMAASRKNMKRLMTEEDAGLLRKRSIIETVWGVLKERYGLVFHLARNITGLFRHYCYSLLSYMLWPFLHSSSSLQLPDLPIGLIS
jgi:hypothetical protein